MKTSSSERTILTISQLNQLAHGLLKTHFSNIWVEGEISNFIRANSGHWYFSLKDQKAQVRCVMFLSHQTTIKFQPENGLRVLVYATAGLYENRGDFQLIVERVEEIGFGALQRAFEQLKQKLQQEGLFSETSKKPLPTLPQTIGVITSPTGAAIHDVLTVLKRRFPLANVIIYPSQVQGAEAANQLVNAIQLANTRKECDVLLLCRGGGSIEDLWPFNEEIVARAIFKNTIPLVSGIGHEVDFTIADFVSDCRAPTPSVAAELVVPNQQKLLQQLNERQQQFYHVILRKIEQQTLHINWLKTRLIQSSPKNQLLQQSQRLDLLERTLLSLQKQLLERKSLLLKNLTRTLEAISPLEIFKRGYAAVFDSNHQLISKSKPMNIGDKIKVQLAQGRLYCTIDKINHHVDLTQHEDKTDISTP